LAALPDFEPSGGKGADDLAWVLQVATRTSNFANFIGISWNSR
jgi:hypothetical protein